MKARQREAKLNAEPEVIHLLIVDDHQMVRDGIKVMLGFLNKNIQFDIEESEDGEDAVKKIIYKDFDVVLLDYYLSGRNGALIAEDILRYKPATKILALSNYDELGYVEAMMQAGAKGYILKNIEPSQLLTAIKTVLTDKLYYSNEVWLKLHEASDSGSSAGIKNIHTLSKREIEVLRLICLEKTNVEIADELCVSKRTIDTHRQNLLLKLHARNTVGLIKAAYKLELIN